MKWFEQLRNLPIGVFAGFLAGILFSLFLGAEIGAELTRYGTFVLSALATLLASGAALATVIWNTEQQRYRKLEAARAMLPMALRTLSEIATKGIDYSLKDEAFLKNPANAREVEDALHFPVEIIEVFRACIENAEPDTRLWFAHTISHYQVYRSRLLDMIGLPNLVEVENHGFSCAFDWCVYHALVAHLYDYARTGRPPSETISRENISAPFNLSLDHSFRTYFVKHRSRYASDGDVLDANWFVLALKRI